MKTFFSTILILLLSVTLTVKSQPILQAKISTTSMSEFTSLGFSVDITDNLALLGAPGKGNERGQACLYQRIDSNWELLTCIDPTFDEADDIRQFGQTVSLSDQYLIIGATLQKLGNNGIAFVFQHDGSSYIQQSVLRSNVSYNNDNFAHSVSLSGTYLAIGSPGIAASHEGNVNLYKKTSSGWVEDIVITPDSPYKSSRFGSSVMMSGEYLIIGDDRHGKGHQGSAYIYRRLDNIWGLQANLKGGEFTKNADFAKSVAISNDYAVVGARSENSSTNKSHKKIGAAYVYKRTGKLWNHQVQLKASDMGKGDNFGTSVAIVGDYILVGSENDSASSGSSYLFRNLNDNWQEVSKLEADDASPQDNFGNSVAISNGYIAIGAFNKNKTTSSIGVGYIYDINEDTSLSDREKALQETLASIDYSSTKVDSDEDGLSDDDEINLFNTDPNNSDSDSDGLTDKEEVTIYQSNPLSQDSDNDGLTDLSEVVTYNSDPILVDTDADGSSDYEEVMQTKTDPSLVDSDNDGFTDQKELYTMTTSPTLADTDGDGLSDHEEINIFDTNPLDADSDNDGFSDGNEVHHYETAPSDNSDVPNSLSSSTSFYPAQEQFGTMAFEDEWPTVGDYDFNDAVFDYNIEETKVDGLISRIVFKVLPTARGAIYENSLRLLINTPISNITHATMKLKGTVNDVSPIADDNQSLFVLVDDVKEALPPPEGYKMTNTFYGSPKVNGNLYTLTVHFNSPISPLKLGAAPYNSFISRVLESGDHMEVHFPGYFPSKKASRRKFGRAQDDSNKSKDRYYQTKSNLPWAMIIPSKWHHPKERIDLSNGYPDILKWASSKGKQSKGWYKSKRKAKFVFEDVPDI